MKKANKALSILAAAALSFSLTGTYAAAFSDDIGTENSINIGEGDFENAVLYDLPEITDMQKTSFADMSDKPVGDMPVAEEVIITDEDNKKLLEISENNRKIKEMSVQTEFPEASVSSTNDFYYEQLSSDYKAMYNETASLLDAMLYGSDDYSSYELIVNWDSGEKDENGNIVPDTQSETVVYYFPVSDINVSKAVIDALLCANPQYFFVECCWSLLTIRGTTISELLRTMAIRTALRGLLQRLR